LKFFRNTRGVNPIGRQPIAEEFLNINLGDKRLSERLTHLADLLGNTVGANIPESCIQWSEIKAAYRFFSNPHINPESLLERHIFNSTVRVKESDQNIFIFAQDTTSFHYGSHVATKNLGSISRIRSSRIKGIQCHAGLIYTPQGTPLGLFFNKMWLRKARSRKSEALHKKRRPMIPIEKKESIRWIQSIYCAQRIQEQTQKKIIIVHDREGAMNSFYKTALDLGISFVVRVTKARVCNESGSKTIKKYLKSKPFMFEMEEMVSQREKISTCRDDYRRYPARTRKATLQVWWEKITIRLKPNVRSKKNERSLTAILIDEKPAPSQKKSSILSWLLFTDQTIETKKDALRIISYYHVRWQLEEFWRIYKTGCKVEDCRLGDGEKLIRFLKVMAVIAWRQHYLTEVGREYRDLPASTCLSASEIKALKLELKIDPETQLTLGEAWHLIAKLGGFMNRHLDGDPGPTTFWKGLQKLIYITHGIELNSKSSAQSEKDLSKAA
jgi:hypothetical protein